jgi:integrase
MENEKQLKNVRLVKTCRDGHDCWDLFHLEKNGKEWKDPYFDFFSEHLLPGGGSGADAWNTRYNYTQQSAHFLDFMIEAVNWQVEQGQDDMTGAALSRLIRKYPKFLAEAEDSGDTLVAEVARRLNATSCAYTSQTVYLAAVNKYLDLSEDFNATMRDLCIRDVNDIPLYSETDLFPEVVGKVELCSHERIALNKKSMLAGVMSGGARMKRLAKLKPIRTAVKDDAEKELDLEEFYLQDHFPFELAPRLIMDGFISLRDKALFCLVMACGCRLHEALLLTWQDIDTGRHLIRLRSPHKKSLGEFGGFFQNMAEISALPWKGRATERTALIEPFKTHFWRLLSAYQNSKEFTLTNSHTFVFQVIKGKTKGTPLVMSDQSNVAAAMVKACHRIGIAPRRPHSLRHMYGVYCLNFIPWDDGTFGMGLLAVKDLMGHASQESTQRYAIPDTQLQMMRQKISFGSISGFTVNTSGEFRLEMMKKEFETLQEAIAHEKLLLARK